MGIAIFTWSMAEIIDRTHYPRVPDYPLTSSMVALMITTPLTMGRSHIPVPGLEGIFVRVGRQVQRSVAFVGFDDPTASGGVNCQGTGFFVAHEGGAYFVTAAHVARLVDGSPFVLRVIHREKAQLLDCTGVVWSYHSDLAVDLAAFPIALTIEAGFGHRYITGDLLVTEDAIAAGDDIDVGDLCYTVGLFRYIYGGEINLPFVHVGNIAVMPPPGERIPNWNRATSHTDLVEAYLIESRAIDGASGSPVFVRTAASWGPHQMQAGNYKTFQVPEDKIRLLGVFQGAWFAPPDTAVAVPKGSIVPVGVGIVVPTQKIIEVLNMPVFKSAREKAAADAAAQQTSVAQPPLATDENPKHREDFMRLANAAARKQPQDD